MRIHLQKQEPTKESVAEQSLGTPPALPPCPCCGADTTHFFHLNTSLTTVNCVRSAVQGSFENTCLNLLAWLFFA